MKRQPGDVHPSEYDWKDQFDVCGMGYIKFDAGKVRGLAQYAEELEARVAELEAVDARLLLVTQAALNYAITHAVPEIDVLVRILADGLAERRKALAGRKE